MCGYVAGERRSAVVRLRVTPGEAERLRREAERGSQTVSDLVRGRLGLLGAVSESEPSTGSIRPSGREAPREAVRGSEGGAEAVDAANAARGSGLSVGFRCPRCGRGAFTEGVKCRCGATVVAR